MALHLEFSKQEQPGSSRDLSDQRRGSHRDGRDPLLVPCPRVWRSYNLLNKRDSPEVCLSGCPVTSDHSRRWLSSHEHKNLLHVQRFLRWENSLTPQHQDFSNEKHMFLVHNSLILVFPVAKFLHRKLGNGFCQ